MKNLLIVAFVLVLSSASFAEVGHNNKVQADCPVLNQTAGLGNPKADIISNGNSGSVIQADGTVLPL